MGFGTTDCRWHHSRPGAPDRPGQHHPLVFGTGGASRLSVAHCPAFSRHLFFGLAKGTEILGRVGADIAAGDYTSIVSHVGSHFTALLADAEYMGKIIFRSTDYYRSKELYYSRFCYKALACPKGDVCMLAKVRRARAATAQFYQKLIAADLAAP